MEQNIQAHENEAVLNSFIELAEHRPKYLRTQLEKILDLMLKVCVYVHVWDLIFRCIHSIACHSTILYRKSMKVDMKERMNGWMDG